MRNHLQKIAGFVLIALVGIMLSGGTAQAQITAQEAFNLFGTEYGDPFSSVFLNQIFGPLFPAVGGADIVTVFSQIIGYFNIIMLVVGGLMFFYNVTVGILQSAHEGSVLGQRWSSLWAPLRVIFAVGLLVPIPGAGGYNLAQTGVAYIVRGATNIASVVWAEAAELVIDGATPITASSPTIDPKVVKTLYNNAVCRAILSNQLSTTAAIGSSPLEIVQNPTIGADDRLVMTSAIRLQGGTNSFSVGICGSYSTPEMPAYISNITPDADEIGMPVDQKATVKTRFMNAHRNSMANLSTAMDNIVASHFEAVRSGQPNANIAPQISAAMTAANTTLTTGMTQAMDAALGADRTGQSARDALRNRITGNCMEPGGGGGSPDTPSEAIECYGEGWIGAGSWYMLMARLNNEISSLTSAQSSATEGSYITDNGDFEDQSDNLLYQSGAPTYSHFNSDASNIQDAGLANFEEVGRIHAGFMAMFEDSTAQLAALGFSLSTEQMTSLMTSTSDVEEWLIDIPGVSDWVTRLTAFVLDWTSPSNGGADPMTGLVATGNMLVHLALAIMALLTAGSFFSVGLAVMMLPIVTLLLTAGGALSFILPMLPFIYWVLAVTGYFLLIIEAVIAVNLWALAHMRMDGEGISGEAGRNGWLMLLSLMMTPVLMIFGFLVGMTIFRVTSALLDIGIHQAITGIAGSSIFIQLIALVVYGIMISMFYIVILERSFSLVSEFPGRVLRWIGAGAELTKGEEGRAQTVAAATGAAVYKGGGAIAGGAARVGGNSGTNLFKSLANRGSNKKGGDPGGDKSSG